MTRNALREQEPRYSFVADTFLELVDGIELVQSDSTVTEADWIEVCYSEGPCTTQRLLYWLNHIRFVRAQLDFIRYRRWA